MNARTSRQWTPLHYAGRGHVDKEGSWSGSFFVNDRKTDLSIAVLLIMNKADINARESESEEGSGGRKSLDLVQNVEHKLGLRATAAVVHAEGARMARGHSTQYACTFWDNLCQASRFCRKSLGAAKDHSQSGNASPNPTTTTTGHVSLEHSDSAACVLQTTQKYANPVATHEAIEVMCICVWQWAGFG